MIRRAALYFFCVLGYAVVSCGALPAQEITPKKKLQVITTLFPVYDFAKNVGQERMEVILLLPPGMEAHSFEPTPNDIVKIHKADVFIYTGKNMEPWVENILKGVSSKNLLVVDASKGINAGPDPHIWLDFGYALAMVDTITQGFVSKDSVGADGYLRNAQGYKARLSELDLRFRETFTNCKLKAFIFGGHSAFGYFAARYGLTCQSPYRGFSPDAEASPKAITELINKIKTLHLRYLYFEELIDPKIARVISAETGAGLLQLHGAHNVSQIEFGRGVTFLEIMEENLCNLRKGLECQ